MKMMPYLARKMISAALVLASRCVLDTSGLPKEDGSIAGIDAAQKDAAVFYDGRIDDGKINDVNDAGNDGQIYFPDAASLPDSDVPLLDGNISPLDALPLDTLLLPADAGFADGSFLSLDAPPLSADANLDAGLDAAVDATIPADAALLDGAPNGNLTPFEQNLSLLEAKLQTLKWVSYAPTNFNPFIGQYPSLASIEEDLQVLYQHNFRGLITYGSENSLQYVPSLAKQVGFTGVIMGIWLPQAWQLENAEAEQQSVEGYCVGNENLNVSYSLDELAQAIAQLRTNTSKPVTTTEQWADYFGGGQAEQFIELSDFIFPNVHPYWAGITEPAEAAQWTADRYQDFIAAVPPEKITFFKEVGLPSAGCSQCNEQNQSAYYQLLDQLFADSLMLFSSFEAFDQPWKNWAAVEPHWGLFYADRAAKAVITSIE